MLKALELFGFKSFADKTRFEFPDGITVVVGPNGSGKSNVVDGMKWALGEQSAKSLRGKEMADVIFKGSGTGQRKPMNSAEVTIVFDNSEKRLALDAPEVHVTRRVFRSGEAEYLINGQACRMRDVKDLFRGTGVGTDAYSIIEQGKVDTLLQSSMKDRRALFEEAAGISRFKAKKIESQRRLERVDQNLLRLSDIVEEVESRLRSVRTQAAKARRYQEYSQRLQQLRTHVAQTDWRELSERLTQLEADLEEAKTEAAAKNAELESHEARAAEAEQATAGLSDRLRTCEQQLAEERARIAALESRSGLDRRRMQEQEQDAARLTEQLVGLREKAEATDQQWEKISDAEREARASYEEQAAKLSDEDRLLAEIVAQVESRRRDHQSLRDTYVARMRDAVTLANKLASTQTSLATLASRREQLADQQQQLASREEDLGKTLTKHESHHREQSAICEARQEQAEQIRQRLSAARRRQAKRQEELAEFERRLAIVGERLSLLDQLERRREGLLGGVQEVLERCQLAREAGADSTDAPLTDCRGVVADFLQAEVSVAPLIDLALGNMGQFLVVDGSRFWTWLAGGGAPWASRVGFVPMGADGPIDLVTKPDVVPVPDDEADLMALPGVIGRADCLVQYAPEFAPLAARLLGQTWLVETLGDALWMRERGGALRFVTRAGEVLEADGTLTVGPAPGAWGLVSRRSELRVLRQQVSEVERQVIERRQELQDLGRQVEGDDTELQAANRSLQEAQSALSALQGDLQSVHLERDQLRQRQVTVAADRDGLEREADLLQGSLSETDRERIEAESHLTDHEQRLRTQEMELDRLEGDRRTQLRQSTERQVELAKCQERLAALESQRERVRRDQAAHRQSHQEVCRQIDQALARRQEAERSILQATSELAQRYLAKEELARDLVQVTAQREELAAARAKMAADVQKLRPRLRKLDDRQRELELAAGEVRHERTTLSDRIREDYGLELAELAQQTAEATAEQQSGEEQTADEEIADLRRKLNNLGAVNLEALAELEQLEERFGHLSGQYKDLVTAKESLEKIIQRINADSRRLFAETLEAIRANFQTMFRKVFGGGHADIVLEPGVDILEAGIEIVATPVGKQSLGLSLLSGGERALTAVTLLLAIFQFRPSPFCVLDEVDGPLDEANIGRFVDVLKGFLSTTKFVVVTHSKKTMTAANTLYGVTMQESGISKRVSVRFEDVSDDGHIRESAMDRDVA